MKKALGSALIALFWLGVWALCAYFIGKPLLLPGPLLTLNTLLALAQTAGFWINAGLTLLRILTGYVCAVLFGVMLGVLCAKAKGTAALLTPLKRVIRATPVSSFIILVLLWIHTNIVPAFIAFLMVLPMVWENVETGIIKTEGELTEMARAYRFTRRQMITEVYAPSALPYLLSSCVTGLGFAWKSGIAAEVIARPVSAIGSRLQDAKVYLETPELFAWTAVVVLLSMLLEKGVKALAACFNGRAHDQA